MIVLITGASSGIGRAMAKNFAARGFNLILVARRKERLEELRREIKETCDVRVKVICKDLSIPQECVDLYEQVKKVKIDILINNAGFGLHGKFNETSLDTELNMIDLNIKAVHILTKLFYIDFRERNYGFILNTASIAGFMAGPLLSTYHATKAYVLQLTNALYEEIRQDNVNVYVGALCPGPVDTEFNKVSGAHFNKSNISMSDVSVAEYAIEHMFDGETIIIPGKLVKATAFASRVVPTKIMLSAAYNLMKIREEEAKKEQELDETDEEE